MASDCPARAFLKISASVSTVGMSFIKSFSSEGLSSTNLTTVDFFGLQEGSTRLVSEGGIFLAVGNSTNGCSFRLTGDSSFSSGR